MIFIGSHTFTSPDHPVNSSLLFSATMGFVLRAAWLLLIVKTVKSSTGRFVTNSEQMEKKIVDKDPFSGSRSPRFSRDKSKSVRTSQVLRK